MTEKSWLLLAAIIVILLILVIWTVWSNTALELNTYTITNNNVPSGFDGFRIAHVSDLHNAEIGNDNEKLIDMLNQSEPDIIAITGDIIDSRNTDIEAALKFAEKAVNIAPCYYVTGNHEARIEEYENLKLRLAELGVTVLEDERLELERSGEEIAILGVNDPSFQTDYLFGDSAKIINDTLKTLTSESDTYTVLLSHRPELFEVYTEYNLNLVLSGHAHGGQFRLPLIGGLAAPNQGLFPKYDAGLYSDKGTNMIVSRGIGNSLFPFRFNNRPEIILIELKHI